jgi:hypothetical protein
MKNIQKCVISTGASHKPYRETWSGEIPHFSRTGSYPRVWEMGSPYRYRQSKSATIKKGARIIVHLASVDRQ